MTANPRYVLIKRLSQGGAAEVFLARHTSEDGFARACAVKRLHPSLAADADYVARLRDEADLCRRLRHDNIVPVLDAIEIDGAPAVVMDYVDGVDLGALLEVLQAGGGRMPTPVAVFIAAEIASGLAYAHGKVDEATGQPLGIVHRDVSPQNVLLGFEGAVKLADFGVARASRRHADTAPGVVYGKYRYMSPEQIEGGGMDHRTDVFALSAVLWECLAGVSPFNGGTGTEIIAAILESRTVAPLRQLNPALDERFVAYVEKGFAVLPDARHASAAHMERELRGYLAVTHPGFTRYDLAAYVKATMTAERQARQEDVRQVVDASIPAPATPIKLPTLATRLKQSAELWLDLASNRFSRRHLDPAKPGAEALAPEPFLSREGDQAPAAAAEALDAGFVPDLTPDAAAAAAPAAVAPGILAPRSLHAAAYQRHSGTLRTLPGNTYRHARQVMMRQRRRRRFRTVLRAGGLLVALGLAIAVFMPPSSNLAARTKQLLRQGRDAPKILIRIMPARRRAPRLKAAEETAGRGKPRAQAAAASPQRPRRPAPPSAP
jgi:serine/threonine-protein kinase